MKIKNTLMLSIQGILLVSIILSQQTRAYADILVLKNGRQIKAESFWKDSGIVKYNRDGSTVGYPIEDVDRIIKEYNPKESQGIPVSTVKNTKQKTANSMVRATPQSKKSFAGIDLSPAISTMLVPLFGILIILLCISFLKFFFTSIFKGLFSKATKKANVGEFLVRCIFKDHKEEIGKASSYERAPGLFTNAEKKFISVLNEVIRGRYLIQGKVRLADIISPEGSLSQKQSFKAFRRISQKHVDFVICDKNDYTILGVIELDDKSHSRRDRIARDNFVNEALQTAGIPILHYPVKSSYSPSELQESIIDLLGLDFKKAISGQPSENFSIKMGDEDKQFVAKEDDLRWAPSGFKI